MKKPKKIPAIPKRFYFSECYYCKVVYIDPVEIQGQRGEWTPNLEEDEPCLGVIRISKEEPRGAQWRIYRHELIHALNDFDYVATADHWTLTFEEKERIEDGE